MVAYILTFILIRYQPSDSEQHEQLTDRSSAASRKTHTRVQSFSAKPMLSQSSWLAYTDTDLRCALVSVYVRWIPDFSCGMVPSCGFAKRGDGRPTSDDPSLKLKPMVATLSRCHTLVTLVGQLKFVLVLLGILAYFWTRHLLPLVIFGTAHRTSWDLFARDRGCHYPASRRPRAVDLMGQREGHHPEECDNDDDEGDGYGGILYIQNSKGAHICVPEVCESATGANSVFHPRRRRVTGLHTLMVTDRPARWNAYGRCMTAISTPPTTPPMLMGLNARRVSGTGPKLRRSA